MNLSDKFMHATIDEPEDEADQYVVRAVERADGKRRYVAGFLYREDAEDYRDRINGVDI